MKILHIITRLILGGAQENTILSCLGQAANRHDVTLAHGPIFGPEGSILNHFNTSTIKLIELPAMVRQLSPITDIKCYHQCRRLIRQIKPDIVHTHSSKAGIIARFAAHKENVPAIVHTIHGLPFHPYQSALKNRIYITAERAAAKRCHKIVTVADAMTAQALAQNIGQPSQYQTIYSGMDIEPYLIAHTTRAATRRKLNLTDTDIVVGTVARLAELKGHDDLLDALPPLINTNPNIKLLWVGDGYWRKRLEKRIKQLNLTKNIILTGLVPPTQIPSLIAAMDILVHPSYREGLPRTLPQALLTAVPVIAYDVDGAPEVCINNKTGLLVPPSDIPALTAAIQTLASNPTLRHSLAQAGQSLCTKNFSTQTMVNALETLYNNLLHTK